VNDTIFFAYLLEKSGMYISYFDESGDDGYPKYSSPLFILSSIYMHHSKWKDNYERLIKFRRYLKKQYNIPVKQELHTREFILEKGIYHGKFSQQERKDIVMLGCRLVAKLNLKIINVCINKTKINRPAYDVLKNALTYNVQRIENDMRYTSGDSRFILITDEGRLAKMTKTTREIQKINFIPSQFNPQSYRKEISCLIEDPLPKKSHQSYFIQLSDMVSFIVSMYVKQNICTPQMEWSKRLLNVFQYGDEIKLMNHLKPVLNLKASGSNEFGIVCYPK
jgi:hypothetical protein